MLPSPIARVGWALIALLLVGCTTDATEVIVRVDTDAPANRALVLTATVHAASIQTGAGMVQTWTRAVDAGAHFDAGMNGDPGPHVIFPATFAIVPGADQPRDEDVVLVLNAVLAPSRLGDPPIQFRRVARFPFVPHRTTTLNIFLALGCGNPATGCVTVPDSRCTVAVRCEEMGQTCGDQARCVTPVSRTTEGDAAADATLGDATGDLACPASCPGAPNARGSCVAGICTLRCDPNFSDCDGNAANGCETNLTASVNNCGTCGHACPVAQFCATGTCVTTCPSMQHVCSGACIDLQSDPLNCGACGRVCPTAANATATCTLGVCGTRCDPSFADCNRAAADGCETNVMTSSTNCGVCGNSCAASGMASAMCIAGSCGLMCAAGRADCDHLAANGCETSVATSVDNCGSCGNACHAVPNATANCSSGTCSFTCNADNADCDGNPANGCETSVMTDPMHCGSCSIVCPAEANASPSCNVGVCALACHEGFANCDGSNANGCEENVQTSLSSCGACGAACRPANANAQCSMGVCGYSACAGGFADVDGVASNGCECALDAYPDMCGSASPVGPVAVGGMTSVSGNIVPSGSSDWFQVTFDPGGHPHITLATDPGGHLLQIQDGGCGMPYMCMDGTGDSVTDWEFFDTPGMHTTRNMTAPMTILFRVFSNGPETCANYTVAISN